MDGNGLLAMLGRAGSTPIAQAAARPAVALSAEVVADSRVDLQNLLRRLGSSLDGLAEEEAQHSAGFCRSAPTKLPASGHRPC
jgi:hypothetical protein